MASIDPNLSQLSSATHFAALIPVWDSGEETRLFPADGSFVVGSDRAADIRVLLPGLAARHGLLICRMSELTVQAIDDNLVTVNGKSVERATVLSAGDLLAIGPATYRIQRRRRNSTRRPMFDSPARHVRTAGVPSAAPAPGVNAPAAAEAPAFPAGSPQLSSPPELSSPPQASDPAPDLQRLMVSEQRRKALDTRETHLAQLQIELEDRSVELDLRADRLTLQQSQLLRRQSELEKRRTAIEASRDEEFRQLSVDKEQVLLAARAQLDQRQVEVDELTARLLQQQQEFDARDAELKHVTVQLASQQGEVTALQQEINTLREENTSGRSASTERIQSLQRHVDELQSRHDLERARWEQEAESLRASLQDVAAQERHVAAAEAALEAAKQEQQQQLEQARRDIEQREAALADQIAETDTQRKSADAAVAEVSTLRAQVDEERRQLQAEREQHETELEAVRREIEDLQSEIHVRREELANEEATDRQRAQELAERESELERVRRELDDKAQQQQDTDETQQQRIAELHTRAEELKVWDAELTQRHSEVAGRVIDLKRLAAAHPPAPPSAEESGRSGQLAAELEEERRVTAQITAERDELSVALSELRVAFESARDELIAMRQQAAESAPADNDSSEKIQSLEAALEASRTELHQTQSSLQEHQQESSRLEQELASLSQQLQEQQQQFAAQLAEAQDSAAASSTDGNAEREEELLAEVESLRAELASARQLDEQDGLEDADKAAKLEEYEQQVLKLQEQLEQAETAQAAAQAEIAEQQAASENSNVTEYLEIINELKARIEVQEQEAARTSDGDEKTGDEIRVLHQELDDRTVLLDNRESDIRERQRMLEHKESEIEEQRRALLEARQQLEMARAEIQVARESEPESSPAASIQSVMENADQSVEPEEQVSAEAQPAVRSEIAELFGMSPGATSAPSPAAPEPVTAQPDLPAVDEYSQETSAAVAMSFDQSEQVLLESAEPVTESTADSSGGQSDDAVASYMEQLLARSRKGAGEALPKELGAGGSQPAAEKPKPAQPAGEASFIEAYMSGQYGSEDGVPAQAQAPSSSPAVAGEDAATLRSKIDLDALRNNMDSFRQLSTKSVEHALATHAKRQESGGLAARKTICSALAMVSVFVIAAAFMDVISFGPIVWLSVLVAVGSLAELAYKTWTVKQRVQLTTETVSRRPAEETPADVNAEQPVANHDDKPPADGAVTPGDDESTLRSENDVETLSREDLLQVDLSEFTKEEDSEPVASTPTTDVATDNTSADSPSAADMSADAPTETEIAADSAVEPTGQAPPLEAPSAPSAPPSASAPPSPSPEAAPANRSDIEKMLAEITGGEEVTGGHTPS